VRLSDITHIGRIIDPRRPSNRVAVLAPIGSGLVLYAFDTGDVHRAVTGALATFAAWAIAREVDPDRPRAATAAALLTPVATIVLGAPAPAPLFVAMLTIRIVVRSTGLPPKTSDLAVLTVGSILVGDTPWGWAAGILLAFAIVRDAALPGEPPIAAGLWGAALAAGVTARVSVSEALGVWVVPGPGPLVALAAGLAGAVVGLRPTPVLSLGDWTRTPLDPRRIREAARFGILTAVVAAVAGGADGIVATAPLLLSFTAVAAVRLIETRPSGTEP
jgi:hypothetical protein